MCAERGRRGGLTLRWVGITLRLRSGAGGRGPWPRRRRARRPERVHDFQAGKAVLYERSRAGQSLLPALLFADRCCGQTASGGWRLAVLSVRGRQVRRGRAAGFLTAHDA